MTPCSFPISVGYQRTVPWKAFRATLRHFHYITKKVRMNISSGNLQEIGFERNIRILQSFPLMSLKLHCVYDIMLFFAKDIKGISITSIYTFSCLRKTNSRLKKINRCNSYLLLPRSILGNLNVNFFQHAGEYGIIN